MPANGGIQDSIGRYRWKNGIQINGMDPGFHRGDDNAGMTGLGVDFESTNSELLGLEPGGVQFWGDSHGAIGREEGGDFRCRQ